jgi:hypothetical protein
MNSTFATAVFGAAAAGLLEFALDRAQKYHVDRDPSNAPRHLQVTSSVSRLII